VAPSEYSKQYINRKGYHSLRIWNAVIRWLGSVHDSRIFTHSQIRDALSSGSLHGTLLGDSGYPLCRYLLTPFRRPNDSTQRNFNKCLSKGRVKIEMCFGILKRRFAILNKPMRMPIRRVPKTVLACIILNNLAINFNEMEEQIPIHEEMDDDVDSMDYNENVDATNFRQQVAEILSPLF